MTTRQKEIITLLLAGGSIAKYPNSPSRVRTAAGIVVYKINSKTFKAVKEVLRREPSQLWVLDKNKVRQLNGNTWIKRQYKALKKLS